MCKELSCKRFIDQLKDSRVNCLTCAALTAERIEEIKREQVKRKWNTYMNDLYKRECVVGRGCEGV